MSDGTRVAVLLLNTNDVNSTSITLPFDALNLTAAAGARYRVRDLWARKELGNFSGSSWTAPNVPVHGSVVVTVQVA